MPKAWLRKPKKIVKSSIIHVVGNSVSILSSQYGKLIDEGDCIIRFNRGGKKLNHLSQGSKTDVLVFSAKFSNLALSCSWGREEKWFTSGFAERKHLVKILGETPSNGIVLLERLKNKYQGVCVRVFGFDWHVTELDHLETKHNFQKEKEYCRKLIKENNWELYQ